MTFKDRFYQSYTSTHVTHRKGEATLDRFRAEFPGLGKALRPPSADRPRGQNSRRGLRTGRLVYWLGQRGYRNAEGIDISAEQVEAAHQLGIANVRQADLTQYLGSHREHYDALILRDVVEHFTREQIIEVLELCRAATRPGGVVIVQVPNAESPFFGRIRYGDFTHELAFTSTSVAQLFNVLGFLDLRVYPTEPVIGGVRSLGRAVLWTLVKAFYRVLLFAELGRGQWIFTQGLIAVGRVPAGAASPA